MRTRTAPASRLALALAIEAILYGCSPAVPNEARGAPVVAIYDPSTAALPAPNDLAIEGGRINIAENPLLSPTENELKLSLNGADGFSVRSAPRVQFTGPLDPASLGGSSFLVLDLGENGQATPTKVAATPVYSDCDHSVSLSFGTDLAPGRRYLIAVVGAPEGLRGADGAAVAPTPAFHFLRAGKRLTEHPDAMPGASRSEKRATAEKLEALREKLEPYVALVEARGIARQQLAALWTFTTNRAAEVYFDSASKRIPFPNDLLRDAAKGRVELPIGPQDSADAQVLKRNLSLLDGFSTTGAISLETTAPLLRSTVTASTVRLLTATGVAVPDVDVSLSASGTKIVVQPRVPLRPASRYVVVATGLRDAQGEPVLAMPLATLLRLGGPLLDDQRQSTLSNVCTTTAERLEPERLAISAVLARLEGEGLRRQDIAAAFSFTTIDLATRARDLWAIPYRQGLPLAVQGVKIHNPPITLPRVSKIVTGTMTTLEFLDPIARAFRANGHGEQRQVEFVLTLPKGVNPGIDAPVVVFGHGMSAERRTLLLVANSLAGAGFAAIAIDLPLHGERTVCLKDDHCADGATCAVDGVCLKNGQKADLARLPNIFYVGDGIPRATGEAFIDAANLFASRDHIRQAFIDLSALTRLIRNMDWRLVTGGYGLDKVHIHYVGQSMGGVIGGSMSGIDPYYERMLLNVGGAGIVDLMNDSQTFGSVLRDGLAAKGIKEGTPEFDQFYSSAKWIFDEVDPINLARFAVREPWSYVDFATQKTVLASPKRFRLHMAQGDNVVPNSATLRLVEATGADKDTQFRSFIGTHAFLAVPAEPACYVGQADMADFLEGKRP